MNIRTHEITAAVAGSDGSATGDANSSKPITGYIEAIKVTYTTQPSTCDVTITEDGSGQPILTLTDANSSGWFYPRAQIDGTDGAAIDAQYGRIPVNGYVNVAVAGGNAGAVAVLLKVADR